MSISHRAKIFWLALGDLVFLYASLLLALYIRYGALWRDKLIESHLLPFTIIFVIWLIVFYIAGLYDLRRLRNNLEFLKILGFTLAVNAGLAIIFFYLIPIFGITPKTNLFIFMGIFALVSVFWRRSFNGWTALSQPLANIALVGESKSMGELSDLLEKNPQFGFKVKCWIKNSDLSETNSDDKLAEEIKKSGVELVIAARELKRDERISKILYGLFSGGMEVQDLPSFYEEIFGKVPVNELSEEWFLEHTANHRRFYDGLKRAFEIIFSVFMAAILSPILLLIALMVKITSRGPIIYSQTRVGKNGNNFTLFKFRSMRVDAEKNGVQWAASKHDPRSTVIGGILRTSHLDELPQLWNITRGDISFVGPRPERPEFVGKLRESVPYYEVRLLVKPGVTGWAQLHHRSDQTIEDVAEKLKYDIYYIKNRSIVIDFAIIIKTLKTLFFSPR